MEDFWTEHEKTALMYHDWPEHGPGAISIEKMYKAFKSRMLGELFSGAIEGCWGVERTDGETVSLCFESKDDADDGEAFLRSISGT